MIHRYLQDHLKCASNQLRQGKARYDKAGLRADALIVGTTTRVDCRKQHSMFVMICQSSGLLDNSSLGILI